MEQPANGNRNQAPTPDPSSQGSSLTIIYLVAMTLSIAMVIGGLVLANREGGSWTLFAVGCLAAVSVLATWPICSQIARAQAEALRTSQQLLSTVEVRLQDLSLILNEMSEQQLLSDRARAVAYREKDREALRRAIREEIAKKDYEAALSLANDMESAFGYKQEADTFRQEIETKRSEIVRKQIADAAAAVERCCRDEGWEDAMREAERVARLYPSDDQARRLPTEVAQRRESHKRTLLESWRDSVSRKDVDGGIEILKKLDAYLTPSEAAEMQEDARAMFRQRLHALSEQFGQAVHNDRIPEAIGVGQQIIRDFPNTRIAQEIRERMDVLRQRATPNEAVPAATA